MYILRRGIMRWFQDQSNPTQVVLDLVCKSKMNCTYSWAKSSKRDKIHGLTQEKTLAKKVSLTSFHDLLHVKTSVSSALCKLCAN